MNHFHTEPLRKISSAVALPAYFVDVCSPNTPNYPPPVVLIDTTYRSAPKNRYIADTSLAQNFLKLK